MKIKLPSQLLLLTILSLLLSSSSIAQTIPDSPTKVNPILINSTIPDVSLKNIDGEDVNLRELAAQQPTMIVFYRGGWCPYCTRHMGELQQIEEEIVEMGYQILAISVDRPEALKKTLTDVELTYTLLSDSPADALKGFGVAYTLDSQTVERYKAYGIDLEKDSGYDHHILPAPAVFLIDTEGTVKFQYVNPDHRERINGDILLAAANAFK
ncbi:MAG: AhpC/TSA family protein [Balneola sp.]|nr:MAG: AhpC/TSA family protein [Balneola sp.]